MRGGQGEGRGAYSGQVVPVTRESHFPCSEPKERSQSGVEETAERARKSMLEAVARHHSWSFARASRLVAVLLG
jgi:hypothetical protein